VKALNEGIDACILFDTRSYGDLLGPIVILNHVGRMEFGEMGLNQSVVDCLVLVRTD
jgi:hypothetical protein